MNPIHSVPLLIGLLCACSGSEVMPAIEERSAFTRELRNPSDVDDIGFSVLLGETRVLITLSPSTKKILVSLEYPDLSEWTVDLSNQEEGLFQPLCIGGGRKGSFFISGKLEGVPGATIYLYKFSFQEGRPAWTSELFLQDRSIVDISAISNLSELNGTLSFWDYGTASMLSLDLKTFDVTRMLDSSQRPELLEVRSMFACSYSEDDGMGFPSGVRYFLQAEQRIKLVYQEALWVDARDYGADGTIDFYEL